jgi:hypothetical protein
VAAYTPFSGLRVHFQMRKCAENCQKISKNIVVVLTVIDDVMHNFQCPVHTSKKETCMKNGQKIKKRQVVKNIGYCFQGLFQGPLHISKKMKYHLMKPKSEEK